MASKPLAILIITPLFFTHLSYLSYFGLKALTRAWPRWPRMPSPTLALGDDAMHAGMHGPAIFVSVVLCFAFR